MSKRVISTSDGEKLQDTKTGNLAGSLPKKASVPTATAIQIDKKKYPLTADLDAEAINQRYEQFVMSQQEQEALAESRRDAVEISLAKKREDDLLYYKMQISFAELDTETLTFEYLTEKIPLKNLFKELSQAQVEALIVRAYHKWQGRGPLLNAPFIAKYSDLTSPAVLTIDGVEVANLPPSILGFISFIKELASSPEVEEYLQPIPYTEERARYFAIQSLLKSFSVSSRSDIDLTIKAETLTDGIESLKEAKAGYLAIPVKGNRAEALALGDEFKAAATDTYISFGLTPEKAYDAASAFFNGFKF